MMPLGGPDGLDANRSCVPFGGRRQFADVTAPSFAQRDMATPSFAQRDMVSASFAQRERPSSSSAGFLQDLQERLAFGRERLPDAIAAHLLRGAGCDFDASDPRCARLVAACAASFARGLVAAQGQSKDRKQSQEEKNAAMEAAAALEGPGYWEDGAFVALGASSVVYNNDQRGEYWVAKFDRLVRSVFSRSARTIWYSCVKYGGERAEALARRHLPLGPKDENNKKRPEEKAEEEKEEPPKKIFRAAPLLFALGMPATAVWGSGASGSGQTTQIRSLGGRPPC